MLGTIMVANVFFVIIPAHWELIRAKEAGREPDPGAGARGKQRSVHNNYLTLPVLFAMLVEPLRVHVRARARVARARRADGDRRVDPPLLQPAPRGPERLVDPGRRRGRARRRSRLRSGRPTPAAAAAGAPVPFARVRGDRRSSAARRATRRSRRQPGFSAPPTGIAFDTPRRSQPQAARDRAAGGRRSAMPLGNVTRHDPRGARRARRVDPSGARIAPADARDRRRRLRLRRAPRGGGGAATVAAFRRLLPLESTDHPRPLERRGRLDPVGRPRPRHRPRERDVLPDPRRARSSIPGGVSETELLLPVRLRRFASKAGALAGNHFATIVEGNEHLRELGRRCLWEGAQEILFTGALGSPGTRSWDMATAHARSARRARPSARRRRARCPRPR